MLGCTTGGSDGELLARFCGQTIPTVPIVVFTPELWVQFQTDAYQGDLGFKAKYLFSGETPDNAFGKNKCRVLYLMSFISILLKISSCNNKVI